MIYTVTLNPALDYVMKVDSLRFDDVNRSEAEALRYGGKGINVSAVLHTLGVENTALGFAAGFTGEKLVQLLKADGIQTDFCFLSSGDTRINVKISGRTPLDFNAAGPAVTREDVNALSEKLAAAGKGDYVVLSGAVPPSLSAEVYAQIMQRLDGRGVRFAVDAAGDALRQTLSYRPFLVKPNHHELGELFGGSADTEETVLCYAKELQKRGAVNVLVSRAENGALLLDADGKVHTIGNAPGKAVNAVGCGDSMLAGFLAGCRQRGDDYAYALRLGTACGNATAYSDGLASRETIDRCLALLHN